MVGEDNISNNEILKPSEFKLVRDESADPDPDTGLKPFLVWEIKTDELGRKYFEAVAKDGTVYTAIEEEPAPVPEKDYKLTVTPKE